MATWNWGRIEETAIADWRGFLRACNERFKELQGILRSVVSVGAGAGTTNRLPKWTGPTTLGDSSVTDTGSLVSTTNPVAIGAAPALIGALRLGNGIPNGVWFRNAANTNDIEGVELDNTDTLRLFGAWYISSTGGTLYPSATGLVDIGSTSKRAKDLHLSGDANIKSLTYVWPAAHASGVLTNNGAGTLSWAASGGGGGGNGGTATLSFGLTGSTSATVTVTGQAWVTGTNAIVCTVVDNARAEDAAIEGLTLTVANQVAGTGFDIIGAPAIGDFVGDVTVAFVGV